MKLPSYLTKAYEGLFQFVAEKRLKARDLDAGSIHTVLSIVLSTSLLMWSHAFLAYATISSPVPFFVGMLASTVHLLCPLVFRFSKSTSLVGNLLLVSGLVHQGTFSFYTGGFLSRTLIWYGILTMLGGLIDGKRGVMVWSATTSVSGLTFLSLHLYGFEFPDLITENGRLLAQILIVFGWIFLSTSIIYFFITTKENSAQLLAIQGKKIDDLVRVLFHDLANPLGRISIGLNITKKNEDPGQAQKGIEIASQATQAMIEITQNVRRMYAISKGKADMELVPFSLVEGIYYVRKVCGDDLERKKIKIEFDEEKYKNLQVLVEPVSFKNQVLCNLISNAVKFSAEKKVIKISAKKSKKGFVQIEIQDQGIGIPATILANLFDINTKSSRIGTKGESGTGFGLHIMKSFVEMYDGEVLVESVEQEGTTFKLTLRSDWTG